MVKQLRCPKGHQWQEEGGDGAGGLTAVCPECGAFPSSEPAGTATLPSGPPPPDSVAVPAVPGYEMLGEIGRGGMGVVYQARQLSLNRRVALKLILAGGHAGPQELARFRTEAEAVARLQHPHIVQVHDFGEHDGRPYLAMEYAEAGNLAQRLHGLPLPPQQAADLVATLARAMDHAHRRGIVHRDLKPANVLLTADGTPKITDFGLAKRLDAGPGHTPSGTVLGTPSYMAPEQAGGGGRQITPAVDVYALGAILYELLTGRPPFLAASPVDTILQVLSEEPVPPRRLNRYVPRDLETVCLKCLQKKPHQRYATVAELADDLERWGRGEPVRARPPSVGYVLGKFVGRNWLAVGAAAAVLLALVLATAIAFYQTDLARRNAEEALRKLQEEQARLVPPPQKSGQDIYRRTLEATGWLLVTTKDGAGMGTCTLVDQPHRLVLTSHHVTDGAAEIVAFFPEFRDGTLVTDRDAYLKQAKERGIRGEVVADEPRRDLALVRLDRLPDGPRELPWATAEPGPGEHVHVVSNPGNSGSLWTYAVGTVHQVYRKQWRTVSATGPLDVEARVVETPWLIGPGAAGAPLVNDSGELAGVASGGSKEPMPLSFFIVAAEAADFVQKYRESVRAAPAP